MGVIGAIAAIASVIVAGVGTGLSVTQAADASAKQEKAQKDLLAKEAKTETQAEQVRARDAGRQRQRAAQASSGGRAGTVLTSPLGVVGEPTTGSKTLLGL